MSKRPWRTLSDPIMADPKRRARAEARRQALEMLPLDLEDVLDWDTVVTPLHEPATTTINVTFVDIGRAKPLPFDDLDEPEHQEEP